jgi:hypothetical protein
MPTSSPSLIDVIDFDGEITPAAARYFLSLDFRPLAKQRAEDLSAKAQDGQLTEAERTEMEELVRYDSLLAVLHSKARMALKAQGSAA